MILSDQARSTAMDETAKRILTEWVAEYRRRAARHEDKAHKATSGPMVAAHGGRADAYQTVADELEAAIRLIEAD
jgi:hypothetical protein